MDQLSTPRLSPSESGRDETLTQAQTLTPERPSAGSRSTSTSSSNLGSSSTIGRHRMGMSVNALLNDAGQRRDRAKGDEVVKALSLHTQASHATIQPTRLEPFSDKHHSEGRNNGVETRNRGRDDDEDGEIDYQGMTPSTWKKWERAGGVKGTGQCYAYDKNGNSYRPELSFVFMLRLVIAASPRKRLSLSSIYQATEERWPYFNQSDTTWKNSIRHCLSYNSAFVNIDRSSLGEEGHGDVDGDGEGDGIVSRKAIGRQGRGRGGYWILADSVDEITHPAHQGSAQAQEIGSGSYWRSKSSINTDSTPTRSYHNHRSIGTSSSTPVYKQSHSPSSQPRFHTQDDYLHQEDYPHQYQYQYQSRPQSPQVLHSRSYHTHPHPHTYNHALDQGRTTTSSSNSSINSGSYGSHSFGSGSYGSNDSNGSYLTDPLGVEMSRAFLAEEAIEFLPLGVDIVRPASR